nr:hypothetical protein [Haliscomenobacter sp.]
MLQIEDQTIQQAQIYYACNNEQDKETLDREIQKWLRRNYPTARFWVEDASNAFAQLFNDANAYFEIKLKPSNEAFNTANFAGLEASMPSFPYDNAQMGLSAAHEPGIKLLIDAEKMAPWPRLG